MAAGDLYNNDQYMGGMAKDLKWRGPVAPPPGAASGPNMMKDDPSLSPVLMMDTGNKANAGSAAPQPPPAPGAPPPAAPASAPPAPGAAASAPMTPAQAAAQGIGWVPQNHQLYGTKGFVGYQDPGAANQTPAPSGPGAGAPGTPPPPAVPGAATPGSPQSPTQQAQAAAAQTNSATPGAAPTENTTNQGGQDVMRNALISQMTSNPIPDVNDPSIQAQLNPFAAAQTRAQRDEVRAGAESAFAGGQSYGNPEKMAAAERAGQATGLRASDLVGQELGARRQQIQQALQQFGSMISDDQRRALEKRGQDIDAQIRQASLTQTGQLGNRELDIRDKIGMGGLNVDLIKTQNQNTQFGQDLGFRVGATQAQLNNQALQHVMG